MTFADDLAARLRLRRTELMSNLVRCSLFMQLARTRVSSIPRPSLPESALNLSLSRSLRAWLSTRGHGMAGPNMQGWGIRMQKQGIAMQNKSGIKPHTYPYTSKDHANHPPAKRLLWEHLIATGQSAVLALFPAGLPRPPWKALPEVVAPFTSITGTGRLLAVQVQARTALLSIPFRASPSALST